MSGICEDAMLCSDAGTRCDDGNECTMDLCDPSDGTCSNPNEGDGTVCEFAPGVGGECVSGVCEDALLCADAGIRCDDGNDCTMDLCDTLDGACSNPNEPNGIACDAKGNPGFCQDGICERDCTPTAGLNVTLPTTGAPTATYTDGPNGFTISAPIGQVTFSVFGVGANANGGLTSVDANDRLVIEFFDDMGGSSTASNVSIVLDAAGTTGTVVITVDDGTPSPPIPAMPGGSIAILQSGVHKVEISVPDLDPAKLYFEALVFDHDCL